MLNEPSILASRGTNALALDVAETVIPAQDSSLEQLGAAVAGVMDVYSVEYAPAPPVSASYTGRLRLGSEVAYQQLDDQFALLDHHVVLTTDDQDRHVILALRGRVRPRPRPLWPHLVLLVLTALSLLFVGAAHQAGIEDRTNIRLWEGIPYALSILLILGGHELGHYFAARYHHVNVTLPYFIPLPISFFGTLGAFIQLREPIRNRKILFDVGVSGPLVGFIIAVPILLIGLATSDIEPLPDEEYILEGDSLLYATAKFAVFGEFLPNDREDVFINQLAKAGWTGLFITGLNLIPLGQLDGGHVVYTLFGKRARRLYVPVLGIFLLLSLWNGAWLMWTLLLFLLGRAYAVPLDTITPLDQRRRWIAYIAIMVFILVFVPNPLLSVQP
ncbi:MAG: site-2 protease family protein [Anaerolineae bacterium]|nr:site-2 protease family protein [Anaerolineae bacterium]